MINQPAILALADGTIYEGISIGAEGEKVGELVFNTAMTGYQEMLTDPSYAQQIITLTAAHVGNTGCTAEDMESSKVWAAGLIIKNNPLIHSNYRAEESLSEWLKRHHVIAIAGIDTRALTRKLRSEGALGACITTHTVTPEKAIAQARNFVGLDGVDLALSVSRKVQDHWDEGRGIWALDSKPPHYHVVAHDFGIKNNILRILTDKGCQVTLVPANTSAEEVLAMDPDGIFLSNGPGDPKACHYAISATRKYLEVGTPLFGICLGFQILALASGGTTSKMKYGHHGINHPVVEMNDLKRVFITSQNHGFTVDEVTLPECFTITHRSLFDNTLQGIKHRFKPALGFQGHPEASPGPHDIEVIFDEFIQMMQYTHHQHK